MVRICTEERYGRATAPHSKAFITRYSERILQKQKYTQALMSLPRWCQNVFHCRVVACAYTRYGNGKRSPIWKWHFRLFSRNICLFCHVPLSTVVYQIHVSQQSRSILQLKLEEPMNFSSQSTFLRRLVVSLPRVALVRLPTTVDHLLRLTEEAGLAMDEVVLRPKFS